MTSLYGIIHLNSVRYELVVAAAHVDGMFACEVLMDVFYSSEDYTIVHS